MTLLIMTITVLMSTLYMSSSSSFSSQFQLKDTNSAELHEANGQLAIPYVNRNSRRFILKNIKNVIQNVYDKVNIFKKTEFENTDEFLGDDESEEHNEDSNAKENHSDESHGSDDKSRESESWSPADESGHQIDSDEKLVKKKTDKLSKPVTEKKGILFKNGPVKRIRNAVGQVAQNLLNRAVSSYIKWTIPK